MTRRLVLTLVACLALLLPGARLRADPASADMGRVWLTAKGVQASTRILRPRGAGLDSAWDGGDGDLEIRVLAEGGGVTLDIWIQTEDGKVQALHAGWRDAEGVMRELSSSSDPVRVALQKARVDAADLALRLTFSGPFAAEAAAPIVAEVRMDLLLPRIDFAPTPPDN